MKQNRRLSSKHLQILYEELDSALIMDKSEFPSGFVTLYSKVQYTNLKDLSEHTVHLVFPAEKEEEEYNCSIFSPVGAALIGEITGSITICHAPAGEIPLRIESILGQ